jgi:hypothetical protein
MALIERGDVQPNREDIIRLLKGENPRVRFVCAGDNLLFINLVEQRKQVAECCKFAVMDDTKTFLGWVPITHQGVITWLPNPESAVKKFIHHDAGIGTQKRPYWADGWFKRMEYYKRNDAAMEAINITNFMCKKHFGYSVDEYARRHYVSPDREFDDLNEDERLFLFNPEYIHYRIDIEKIRPELLERMHTVYYHEETELLRSLMTKGG